MCINVLPNLNSQEFPRTALLFGENDGSPFDIGGFTSGRALGAARKRVIFIDIRAIGSEVAVSPPAGK